MAPKVTVTRSGASEEGNAPKGSSLVHVTDARGRKIGLRKPPFLEEFRIIEAAGPELSANTTYMSMLNPLLYVAEIDGVVAETPRTKLQIESLIQWAGQEGFVAVVDGISKHFMADRKTVEQKIKNSDGTPASETVAG